MAEVNGAMLERVYVHDLRGAWKKIGCRAAQPGAENSARSLPDKFGEVDCSRDKWRRVEIPMEPLVMAVNSGVCGRSQNADSSGSRMGEESALGSTNRRLIVARRSGKVIFGRPSEDS